MTREEKITIIFSEIDDDANLIKLVRAVFKNNIPNIEDALLDKLYYALNPPIPPQG